MKSIELEIPVNASDVSMNSADRKENTQRLPILRVENGVAKRQIDVLATEEPLEIRIAWDENGKHVCHSIAVTMRTPGHDFELAAGFLLSEGIITERANIKNIRYCQNPKVPQPGNIVTVQLSGQPAFDPKRFSRNVLTNSSCGICGRQSLEMVRNLCPRRPAGHSKIGREGLAAALSYLNETQEVFSKTGGLHASALFDKKGCCIALHEDVGRHNALDKIVGAMLMSGSLPGSDTLLLVSGRLSFELVQKALIAGMPCIAAIGAPSNLAVEMAQEFGMTLIGFLSEQRFNVYAGAERVAY